MQLITAFLFSDQFPLYSNAIDLLVVIEELSVLFRLFRELFGADAVPADPTPTLLLVILVQR